jgi:predicted nucleic acid-binding protein
VIVVADTSPLIYLSRAGVLDLLQALYGEVVVPRAVWTEAVDRRPSAPGLDALKKASWIRVGWLKAAASLFAARSASSFRLVAPAPCLPCGRSLTR